MLDPSLTDFVGDHDFIVDDVCSADALFLDGNACKSLESSLAKLHATNVDDDDDDDDDDELDEILNRLVSQPDEQLEVDKRRRLDSKVDVKVSLTAGDDDRRMQGAPSPFGDCPSSTATLVSVQDTDEDDNRNDGDGGDDDDDDDEDDIDTVSITDAPLPHPSYGLTESLVAKKMSKLSMQEREAVYYDIHGVSDAIDEEAEEGFVDRKLRDMEHEMTKIGSVERRAYEMARSTNQSYVDDRNFRLRFLRADRFDPKLAADRYARHYQTKLELFGGDKLGRDILQDDLGEEALGNLYSGMNQLLPRRDNAGRLVWIWIAAAQEQTYSSEAILRRVFYNNMMISEDVETQRKGSVGVFYTLNHQQTRRGSKGSNSLRSISGIARSLPMPIVSVHFCYNNYAWLPVLSIAQLSSHLFIRLRIRAHFGSHVECMYKLQTFGIPADTIPVNENGEFNGDNHRRSLEKRRKQEREWQAKREKESTSSSSSSKSTSVFVTDKNKVSIPARFDVLLGRGRGYFNHVGNVRYRVLIDELKDQYEAASKKEKQEITDVIITKVQEKGGRFLKDHDGVWIPIDEKSTRQKIGHSFRALRTPKADGRAAPTAAPTSKRMFRE